MAITTVRMRGSDASPVKEYVRHDVVHVVLFGSAPAKDGYELVFFKRQENDKHYAGLLNGVTEHKEEGDRGSPRRTAVRGLREELGLNVPKKRLTRLGGLVVLDDANGYHINVDVYTLMLRGRDERKIREGSEVVLGSQVRMGWEQALEATETLTTLDSAIVNHFAPNIADILPFRRA